MSSCANPNFTKGDLARVSGTIAGTANLDPTAVFAQVRNPAGSVTTYEYGVDAEVNKSAVGVYYIDVNLNIAGTWYYRFYSTGTGQAVAADQSLVAHESIFD